MIPTGKKQTRAREKNAPRSSSKTLFYFFLFFGFAMVAMSFVSEINFHYWQGFMPENLPEDVFWRAEYSEVFNSITFLVIAGVSFVMAGFAYKKVSC